MSKIAFPAEIRVFGDLLSSESLTLLEDSLSKSIRDKKHITLKDWYISVKEVQKNNKITSTGFLALMTKLAWILADLNFFSSSLITESNHEKSPLLDFYFGIGIAEFIDFTRGFTMLKDSFPALQSMENPAVLLDIATPYALILNNSDNHKYLKEINTDLQMRFNIETSEQLTKIPQLIPIYLFSKGKGSELSDEERTDLLSSVQKHGNNLDIAIAFTMLSSKDDKPSHLYNMMSAIKHLGKINANYRLLIAYTNYAIHLSSQTGLIGAREYFDKALEIATELSNVKDDRGPLVVYPLSQLAELMIHCGELDNAHETFKELKKVSTYYNNIMYQTGAEFGLAYIDFLRLRNDSAMDHIKDGLSVLSKSTNEDLVSYYELKFAELLLDLNKVSDAEEILSLFAERELDDCSLIFYKFIKSKFELNNHNIGTARSLLSEIKDDPHKCKHLRPSILFSLTECYLYQHKISENDELLSIAHKTIEEGLKEIEDAPRIAKGKWLMAILLVAQGKFFEAEDILIELTTEKIGRVPRINVLAEELLDTIRQRRVESVDVSPISNIKDVVRYLRDVKTFVELDSH
jgi:tetratricopeptide (TPR) repeat protein